MLIKKKSVGNRIAKHVYNNTGTTHERSTYYILDAQGNQISTYDHEVVSETAQFNLKERNIFGSSRLGSKQDSLNVLTATLTQNYTQILGTKYYEFSNHLGNVLTVFSDVKIALDTNSNGVVDGFRVPIRNIADYSPFGVQLDGRTQQGDFYRFGYQGSEKDDVSKGSGNSYTTFYRQLDPRVGRWFSIDPVEQPWQSPYCSMDNNPVFLNDVLGNYTEFKDKKAEKDFNNAQDKVKNKISSLEKSISVNSDKLKTEGLKPKEVKKINNEIEKTQGILKDWKKLESDFETIKSSPVKFVYSSDMTGIDPRYDGETGAFNDYLSKDESGEINGGKVSIFVREGKDEIVIHENRHGNQRLQKTSATKVEREIEGFIYQKIYSALSVENFINNQIKDKYRNIEKRLRPNMNL